MKPLYKWIGAYPDARSIPLRYYFEEYTWVRFGKRPTLVLQRLNSPANAALSVYVHSGASSGTQRSSSGTPGELGRSDTK